MKLSHLKQCAAICTLGLATMLGACAGIPGAAIAGAGVETSAYLIPTDDISSKASQ